MKTRIEILERATESGPCQHDFGPTVLQEVEGRNTPAEPVAELPCSKCGRMGRPLVIVVERIVEGQDGAHVPLL